MGALGFPGLVGERLIDDPPLFGCEALCSCWLANAFSLSPPASCCVSQCQRSGECSTHKRRVCLNTDNRIVGAHTQSSRDPVSHRTLTLLDGQEGRHVGNRPPVTTHFQPCGQGRSSESLRLPASLLASLLPTKRWDVVPSSTPALSNACPNGTASLMRFETLSFQKQL